MTFRHWLRILAVFLLAGGFLSLPNPGGSPKRLTSLFSHLADSGSIFHLGLTLIAIGLLLFLASFLGDRS